MRLVVAGVALAMIAAIAIGIALAASMQPSTSRCECVAFRFDDVQDYFLHDVQIHVMNEFAQRDLNLTVGVIGNYFGNDQELVSYIKEGATAGRLEVANHGWNHESFIQYSKEEQSHLMNQTNSKLYSILGVRPIGFIAPFNTVNNDTFEAARENKMMYISANMTMDRPPYHERKGLYHYPLTAITGNLNDDDTEWLGFGHEATMIDIKKSIREHGFAVVNMHPMEFAVRDGVQYSDMKDERQLAELDLLLSTLQKEKSRIVTVGELATLVVS